MNKCFASIVCQTFFYKYVNNIHLHVLTSLDDEIFKFPSLHPTGHKLISRATKICGINNLFRIFIIFNTLLYQ